MTSGARSSCDEATLFVEGWCPCESQIWFITGDLALEPKSDVPDRFS